MDSSRVILAAWILDPDRLPALVHQNFLWADYLPPINDPFLRQFLLFTAKISIWEDNNALFSLPEIILSIFVLNKC